MIKSIALDIGGVCISLHFEKTLEFLGCPSLEAIPVEFVAATDMLEMGKITVPDWLNVFHEITDNQFTDNELRDAWSMIIGNDIDGMAELAQELVDCGYRLVFFSDTSEIHMQEVYRNLSFANLVTGAVFSYEAGFKKPASEMYAEFEKNTANRYSMPMIVPVTSKEDCAKAGRATFSLLRQICAQNLLKTVF